jgi:hypothetical protein
MEIAWSITAEDRFALDAGIPCCPCSPASKRILQPIVSYTSIIPY